MAMKFRFKNIMERGERKHELIEISGVERISKLPREYTESGVRIYDRWGIIVLHHTDGECCILERGMWFSSERTAEILSDIAAAGRRLTKINKKIKEKARNWEGKIWEVNI